MRRGGTGKGEEEGKWRKQDRKRRGGGQSGGGSEGREG